MDTSTGQAMQILVIVHPGSACGSANFNLGRAEANAARAEMIEEIEAWQGGVVVIHGALSDELSAYPLLDKALAGALARAKKAGLPGDAVQGGDESDFNQVAAIRGWTDRNGDKVHSFTVTGAWYHPENGGGCVGSVIDALRERGYRAEVSGGAVCLDMGEGHDDRDEVATRECVRARRAPGRRSQR